jgi:hypothetical protein
MKKEQINQYSTPMQASVVGIHNPSIKRVFLFWAFFV